MSQIARAALEALREHGYAVAAAGIGGFVAELIDAGDEMLDRVEIGEDGGHAIAGHAPDT